MKRGGQKILTFASPEKKPLDGDSEHPGRA